MTTGKIIAFTRQTFVGKVMSLLFNMLSRLVITFLPRSKRLWNSWLHSPSAVILGCMHLFKLVLLYFGCIYSQEWFPGSYNSSIVRSLRNLPTDFHSEWVSEWVEVAPCLTLCNLMDYTVDGILQARILEWVAFPFSMKSSQSSNQTQVSHITGRFFTSWATRESQEYWNG